MFSENATDAHSAVFRQICQPAITHLMLTAFRNYDRLELALAPEMVVLTGNNGAGKTNLLEALSLMAPGRGLRRGRFSEMAYRPSGILPAASQQRPIETPSWAVAATFAFPDGPLTIGTGKDPKQTSAERRVVQIAGDIQRSLSSLSDYIGVLWLTPAMDRLFQEGPSNRRRFLDRLVYGLDSSHAGRINSYEQVMRQRTKLLRDGSQDREWLTALENSMAERGCAIAAARRDLMNRLAANDRLREERKHPKDQGFDHEKLGAAAFAQPLPGQAAFPTVDLALEGLIEGWLDHMPALEAEDRFRRHLADHRRRDAAAGAALDGPHRSDLKVWHRQKGQKAEHCSTGEQKALLVALILANAMLQAQLMGQAPLLLLDEVAAHLDEQRRAALCDALQALGGQVWMTGTDPWLFSAWETQAQFLTARDGRIQASGLR